MLISPCSLSFYVLLFTILVLVGIILLFCRRYRDRTYINCFVFLFLTVSVLGWGLYYHGWIGLSYGFGLVLLIGLPVEIYLRVKRSRQVVEILNDGDPEIFLVEIEKDIQRSLNNSYQRYQLMINKTAGLYYFGKWQEALEILEKVPKRKLPVLARILYVNNKLANHLGLGDVAGAQKVLDENKDLLNRKPMSMPLFYSLKRNQAILEFLKDNFTKSRVWIEECLETEIPKTSRSALYYYLGLIEQKEGNEKQAKEHFKMSFEAAPKTFFGKRARELEQN